MTETNTTAADLLALYTSDYGLHLHPTEIKAVIAADLALSTSIPFPKLAAYGRTLAERAWESYNSLRTDSAWAAAQRKEAAASLAEMLCEEWGA